MSADPIDVANETAERMRQEAINNVPRAKKLLGIGRCYNCDDRVPGNQAFCDQECCEEYEWVQQRKAANRR